MKHNIIFLFLIIAFTFSNAPLHAQSGKFPDPRDGKTYQIIKIGNQVWMAENLAYEPSRGNYWAYDNDNRNVETYGYLYDWKTACDVCPTGWHLPSLGEFETLLYNYLGTSNGAYVALKEGGSSGFTALLGGGGSRRGYGMGEMGDFWSSTEYNSLNAWYMYVSSLDKEANISDNSRRWGLSVRCVKDYAQQTGSFIDARDEKTYKTVTLGNQVWMAENLNYETSSGSWCYDNKSRNCSKYGRLYTYETAKNVCPSGWHLPSKAEFETLLNNYGGEGYEAYVALRGSSGFTALFGGIRDDYGYYDSVGDMGFFWSSTEDGSDRAWHLNVSRNNVEADMIGDYLRSWGHSVRCVQD